MEEAFSENMMDIIVEHQQPSKNAVIKYHDRASDEIQDAARDAVKR